MGFSLRRWLSGALLALTFATMGCGTVPKDPPVTLAAGYPTMDGALRVWPARGGLIQDVRAREAVARVVADWRSPLDDRVHLPSSGILWFGEVEGVPLALVAATVPGRSASWLLQVVGDGDGYRIDRATDYTEPGYLVYADLLPVQVPEGRRYLTSARVERLTGPDGRTLAVNDGLSVPVAVPRCAAVTITARLRPTESLPEGRNADRVVDLGTGVVEPRYPLVADASGSAGPALRGLDTCALAERGGPFGSIPRRIRDEEVPEVVPLSWPIDQIGSRALGEVELAGIGTGQLDQLTWRGDGGMMTAVVFRPDSGGPAASGADRVNSLQVYEVPLPQRPIVALVWRQTPDNGLNLPAGLAVLVDRPGLVLMDKPAGKQTFSLAGPDRTSYRSIGED